MNLLKNKKVKVMEYNDDWLIKRLRKNPKELEEYIDSVCEDYAENQELHIFLESLKVAIMAKRGAATKIAKNGNLERTSIYRSLSSKTNPRIETLQEILTALGRCIIIGKPKETAAHRKAA